MSKQAGVTEKQLKILRYIEKEIQKTGQAPTYRAIAAEFEFSAIGTVQDHLARLIEHGFLERQEGQSRGIRLPFQSRVTWIPILGSAPAGRPMEAIEDHQGGLALTGHWKGDHFALKVKGESMRDKGILNGDTVVVRKQNHAEDGEIVVASIDHEATVKTLKKSGNKLRLLPANPDFRPIDLDPSRENQILGKVVVVYRNYEKE